MTTKGYLGVGDQSVAKGDRVCIFHGAPVPFILREIVPKSFELIGECYVHGIMDGEFFSEERPTVEYSIH